MRTAEEINAERTALKALRGDFREAGGEADAAAGRGSPDARASAALAGAWA